MGELIGILLGVLLVLGWIIWYLYNRTERLEDWYSELQDENEQLTDDLQRHKQGE